MKLEELILDCHFNLVECGPEDFEWFHDTYYGSCFKFNADKTKFSLKKGKLNGLDLKLYIPKPYGEKNLLSESRGVN